METVRDRGKPGIIRRFFSALGPRVTAGAADDDPSGIATYSIVGAQLGTSLLWTAFITWPLMACVQFMCARIGMVTGMGLGDALRRKARARSFSLEQWRFSPPTASTSAQISPEWRMPRRC